MADLLPQSKGPTLPPLPTTFLPNHKITELLRLEGTFLEAMEGTPCRGHLIQYPCSSRAT